MEDEGHRSGRISALFAKVRALSRFVGSRAVDLFVDDIAVIVANGRVFAGMILFLIGLFGFESDRYCDGNTATYLSCTRPSTYYYFSAFDIFLIVIGATLVLLWLIDRPRQK